MRRIFLLLAVLLVIPFGADAATPKKTPAPAKKTVAKRVTKPKVAAPKNLVGGIAKQQENDRLWYVTPDKKERYLLKNSGEAQSVIEALKVIVPPATLAKIPTTRTKQQTIVNATTKLYSGTFITIAQDENNVWYVDPAKNIRVSLGTPPDAWFATIQNIAITASAKDVARYAMNQNQSFSMFDPLFSGVAYVTYDGLNFMHGSNDSMVLPLASLTKLMTALVVMDTNPDWSQSFFVSPDVIQYPKNYYPEGGTSEVSLKAGDTVTLQDLRVALLVASSNQAADALARATGLPREEFIRRMNEKAVLFGLEHTIFYDVAGLDVRNVSTPREMAVIAERAFANDLIAATSVTTDYTIIANQTNGVLRPIPVTNRNTSLLAFAPEGAKSGYLAEAQRNAVIRKDGKIMVVMHARSLTERNSILGKLVASVN